MWTTGRAGQTTRRLRKVLRSQVGNPLDHRIVLSETEGERVAPPCQS